MNKLERLYMALVAAFIMTFSLTFPTSAGILPTIVLSGSMLIAFVVWARTSLRYPPDPKRVLPIYLIVTALLMVHIGEEYLYKFGPRIAGITGTAWAEGEFLFSIVFLVPLVWITGAALTAIRHPIGGFITWFIFVGMILGEPTHLAVFPVLEGGRYHYFPGMWTALVPLVPAIWGMQVMVADYRQAHRAVLPSVAEPASQ